MMAMTSFAATVMVPDVGWLIYGGGNNLGSTQVLSAVNQQWMAGPPIFNGQANIDGNCAVQVS